VNILNQTIRRELKTMQNIVAA